MCDQQPFNPFPFAPFDPNKPLFETGKLWLPPGSPTIVGPLDGAKITSGSITVTPVDGRGNPKLPRGIRNNNPGNIERTTVRWKGMAVEQLDSRFITFVAPQWGIRAIARILLGDWREGQDTIASLIHEWAPPVENDTDSYVKAVGRACGVDPYVACEVPQLLPKIIPAIIQHENGMQPYSLAVIQLGIDLERSA